MFTAGASSAGSSPDRIPVRHATAMLKASTAPSSRISPARGTLKAGMLTMAAKAHFASSMPIAPPTPASTRLSANA